MAGWHIVLTAGHIIGTALGVGGATLAEIFYLRSSRDGVIDTEEAGFLKTTYRVIRVGMLLLVLSGFGYLLLARIAGATEVLYGPKLWAKLTIIFVLLAGVLLWQARKVPMWLGSPVSLVSWYAALILGVWRGLGASYITIMVWYVAAIVIMGIMLHVIRRRLGNRSKTIYLRKISRRETN